MFEQRNTVYAIYLMAMEYAEDGKYEQAARLLEAAAAELRKYATSDNPE